MGTFRHLHRSGWIFRLGSEHVRIWQREPPDRRRQLQHRHQLRTWRHHAGPRTRNLDALPPRERRTIHQTPAVDTRLSCTPTVHAS